MVLDDPGAGFHPVAGVDVANAEIVMHRRVMDVAADHALGLVAQRFPLDQSRVAYLRYLRRERRQSPLAEAEHAKAKTELLQVRIEEKYLAAPNGIGVIVGGRLFRHCERSKGIHRTTAKTWVAPSLRSSR
jgi:hypothetical protein